MNVTTDASSLQSLIYMIDYFDEAKNDLLKNSNDQNLLNP